ncbi:hypothetical protein SSKA14_3798 [Stenotrophomonas sp. SKA14]|nr:hypothetical protein SSKA14_3798 [Stenotrophomonas sp. SKA14]
MGKRDILPCFRALWQGVDATQCRAGGDPFRGRTKAGSAGRWPATS